MAEESADIVNEDAAADETEQGGRNMVPSSCTAEEERLRLQLIEMSIIILKVPAFALRDKATNEYFTTVDDIKRAANEWSSTAAYAQQRREFAMRKERDFLLAVARRGRSVPPAAASAAAAATAE